MSESIENTTTEEINVVEAAKELIIKDDKKPTHEHIVDQLDMLGEQYLLTALGANEACKTFMEYELPIMAKRLVDSFHQAGLEYYAVKTTKPKKAPFAVFGLYNIAKRSNTAKLYYVDMVTDNESLTKHVYEIAMTWIKAQRNIRKLNIELVESSMIKMFMEDGWLVEGVLKDHIYITDKYHDVTILGKKL